MARLTVLVLLFVVSFSGADIQRFKQVDKQVFRGDQPDTIEDYQQLAKIGVRTIVNLRNDNSVRTEVHLANSVGIKVIHFPMSTFTFPSPFYIGDILATLADPKNHPVFYHCQYGKDRTGLISALYRVHFQNWPKREAYSEMISMGFSPLLINFRSYFFMSTLDSD